MEIYTSELEGPKYYHENPFVKPHKQGVLFNHKNSAASGPETGYTDHW